MRYYFLILFTSLSVFLVSCAFAPVNNQYEKARTLKKGNVELAEVFQDIALLAEEEVKIPIPILASGLATESRTNLI